MKIIVETERHLHKACGVDFQDPPIIRVRVKVDGEEEYGLQHVMSTDEMRSDFDILWEYIGDKIKRAHKERKE